MKTKFDLQNELIQMLESWIEKGKPLGYDNGRAMINIYEQEVKNINYDTVLDAVCCPKCGKDEVETNSNGNWCINCNHKWGN